MTVGLDDETEPAGCILAGGNEEAAFLGAGATPPAGCGDALDETLLLPRRGYN